MTKRRGYTEQASRQLDGEVGWPREGGASDSTGPYAIRCQKHGQVFITDQDYERQLMMPDALWTCPTCGEVGFFDDKNYEEHMEQSE